MNYVLRAPPEHALDLVELVFRGVQRGIECGDYVTRTLISPEHFDALVAELNQRFRENGCGYQYEDGYIIRVDSQLLHPEVIRPALALLSAAGFEGPNKEFLAAHEHLRHGRVEAAERAATR